MGSYGSGYVADSGNHRIQKVLPGSRPLQSARRRRSQTNVNLLVSFVLVLSPDLGGSPSFSVIVGLAGVLLFRVAEGVC